MPLLVSGPINGEGNKRGYAGEPDLFGGPSGAIITFSPGPEKNAIYDF